LNIGTSQATYNTFNNIVRHDGVEYDNHQNFGRKGGARFGKEREGHKKVT
jgi:hypothetical protein